MLVQLGFHTFCLFNFGLQHVLRYSYTETLSVTSVYVCYLRVMKAQAADMWVMQHVWMRICLIPDSAHKA